MTPAPDSRTPPSSPYIGRFAPSPSGPLHMGSLVAALASFLEARACGGRWLVRIEDLDPPREQPGADRLILETLERTGLHWDGTVHYQSQRHEAYAAALDRLSGKGLLFYCRCSRRQLREQGGSYPGTCRGFTSFRPDSAIRLRTDTFSHCFDDLFQGNRTIAADNDGDFIVRRRDGLYAYQLAVVVDDAWQAVTHVIRGIDLLDNTGRQVWLQRQLGFATPVYGHFPVIINDRGQKLSKQHRAPALDPSHAHRDLLTALRHLRQPLPDDAEQASVTELIDWAIRHWDRSPLTGLASIAEFRSVTKGDTPEF